MSNNLTTNLCDNDDDLPEYLENYCLNKAMEEAKLKPLSMPKVL